MFKAGQIVRCRIKAPSSKGWEIELEPQKSRALLMSNTDHSIGSELEVVFVTNNDGQDLFSEYRQFSRQTVNELLSSSSHAPVLQSYLGTLIQRANLSTDEAGHLTLGDLAKRTHHDESALSAEDLQGAFEENFLKILVSWHNLTEADAEKIAGAHDVVDIEARLSESSELSSAEIQSMIKGLKLVLDGKVTFPQFAVAYKDFLDGCMAMEESLQLRGWQ